MHTPIAKRGNGLSYGLGWKIKQYNGLQVVEHAGGYPGVSCFVSMVPERNFGLTLLCNMDTIKLEKLSDRIINRLF